MVLPATWPLVKTGVILSAYLIRRASMPSRLPDGMSLRSWKYSASTTSKEFGWVMIRLATSSVVTGMYSMTRPRSAFTFCAISFDWLTAVPR